MGLLTGLVLSLDRRAALAVAGVAVSVIYTLVAASVVGGLKDSQSALGAGLQDTDLVAMAPGMAPIETQGLPAAADHEIHVVAAGGQTFFFDARDDSVVPGTLSVGPATGWRPGEIRLINNASLRVSSVELALGADPAWVRMSSADWEEVARSPPAAPHVLVYETYSRSLQRGLEGRGLLAAEAPATLDYYARGAEQLTAAVSTTVGASTAVIFLLTATFLHLDFQARRRSFATLRLFSGPGFIRRILVVRGGFVLLTAHVAALAATLLVLKLLDRADAVNLSLPWGRAVVAMAFTLGGGLAAVLLVVLRMPTILGAAELGVSSPRRRLPAPLRPVLLSWRASIPFGVAALVCAASLGTALGVADVPFQIFGTQDSEVVAGNTGNPLRGEVDAFMGLHMRDVEGFRGASPEIFAPTVIDSKPMMARGVDWPSLLSMNTVRLTSGNPPEAFGEVVLGRHAARELGAQVGDRLVIPASYASFLVEATVVGVADAGGILDDEVLVDLSTARALTAARNDTVHLIRYRTDADFITETGQQVSLPTGIEVAGLELRPARPVAGQEAVVLVRLVNFDQLGRARTLTLFVNGAPLDDLVVNLPPRSVGQAELAFRVPNATRLEIRVNPHLLAEAEPSAYDVFAPTQALVGDMIPVRVRSLDGQAASGVRVVSDGSSATTDASGLAALPVVERGNRTVLADGPAGRGATSVLVLRPEDQNRSRLEWLNLNGPEEGQPGPWVGSATVQNMGGLTFDGLLPVPVDGVPVNTSAVRLGPGARVRVDITLTLEAGHHIVGPPEAQLRVHVRAPGDPGLSDPGPDGAEPEAMTVEDLLKARRARGGSRQAAADPVAAFLGDTYENFNTALTVVVLATLLHSGLVLVAAVQREIEERTPRIGTLLAVGSHRTALRDRLLREFVVVGGIGVAMGTLAGLGLAGLAAEFGYLKGFGHALAPRITPFFAFGIWFVNVAVLVATALLAGERVRERTVRRLLQEGPARSRRPSLQDLLEGE